MPCTYHLLSSQTSLSAHQSRNKSSRSSANYNRTPINGSFHSGSCNPVTHLFFKLLCIVFRNAWSCFLYRIQCLPWSKWKNPVSVSFRAWTILTVIHNCNSGGFKTMGPSDGADFLPTIIHDRTHHAASKQATQATTIHRFIMRKVR